MSSEELWSDAHNVIGGDARRFTSVVHDAVRISGSKLHAPSLKHRTRVHRELVTKSQDVAKLMKEDSLQLREPGAADSLLVDIDIVEIIGVGEECFGNQLGSCGIVPWALVSTINGNVILVQ